MSYPCPSRPGVVVRLISVRMLRGPAEMLTAQRLLQRVWGSEAVQLDAPTLQAFAHTGNYVAGAFRGGGPGEPAVMVGCAVGFFAAPDERSLHSHIAGVDREFAGRGIGMALKHHQRGWCLERGVTSMTWTFDPAVARNAFFNITKLGVRVVAYLEDFYGPLDDGLNAGSPSDRLFVRWDLRTVALDVADVGRHNSDVGRPFDGLREQVVGTGSSALVVKADGGPAAQAVDPLASAVLVEVPQDIEDLRRTSPELASAWRFALREVLGAYVNGEGWRIRSFLRPAGYLLERTP